MHCRLSSLLVKLTYGYMLLQLSIFGARETVHMSLDAYTSII